MEQILEAPALKAGFSLGSTGDQYGKQVLTDAAGNVYLAGVFTGTVDFDPGTGVSNLTSTDPDGNIFVAKYSPTGALTWARSVQMSLTFDSFADDVGVHLGLDTTGNVYLSGEYEGTAVFSPGGSGSITLVNSDTIPGSQHRDVFIGKLDSTGKFLWAGTIGSAGNNDFVDSMAVDPTTGNVSIAGAFAGTVDFDPGAGVAQVTASNGTFKGDGYILELDSVGAFKWVRNLGGASSEAFVGGLAYDNSQDLIATGSYKGTPDIDGQGTSTVLTQSNGGDDIFVAKYAGPAGSVLWSSVFGGPGDDRGNAVAVNSANEVFVTGEFSKAVRFDSSTPDFAVAAGGTDVFVMKLNNAGGFSRATGFG